MSSDGRGDSISALTAAASVDGTELVPLTQSTRTKRTTLQIIADWIVQTALSFTQSGIASVAGTVQERLRLEINLWDALSTSERADMGTASLDVSAAVATAIGWFGANGGILVVPGYFGLGATGIAMTSKTGIVIEGRGPKAGFKVLTVSATALGTMGVSSIRLSSNTRCGLRNLYIDNDSKANNVIAGLSNTECFVDGCTITGGGLNASIFFNSGTGNRFTNNVIKDSAANSRGLWIGNAGAGEKETYPSIIGNYVNNTGYSGIGGMTYRGVIANNRVIDTDGSGIVLAGDADDSADAVVISGNYCRGNAFHGIQVGDPTSVGDFITGISVTGNICDGNTQDGITVIDARDSTISGNVCRDNGNAGVQVSRARRLTVTGNTCYETRSAASRTQDYGIRLVATTAASDIEDVMVSGNVCYNNVSDGILLQNSGSGTIDTVAIVGNMCTDNSVRGIGVADAADGDIAPVTCVGNTCLGNTSQDIRMDPSNVVLSGNKFSLQLGMDKAFASTDATPSVAGRSIFKTANASATTITAFDDGVEGQQITVLINDANTTIDFTGTTLKGNGGADWSPTTGDSMICTKIGTNWYCQISDNTA